MGVQKKGICKTHNGTDYDIINLKTVASQVKMDSGINLEEGFANSKAENGYTKLPNGMIFQWGLIEVFFTDQASKTVDATLTIPYTKTLVAVGSERDNSITNFGAFSVGVSHEGSGEKMKISVQDLAQAKRTGRVRVSWLAIGY